MEKLGRGEVWRVERVKDGKQFVAKKQTRILSAGETQEELQFLQKMEHPNIVGLVEYYYKKSEVIVVLEYCGGHKLSQKIKIWRE